MSDRTFRLIFDGKKGGLYKGSTPSSAAKKAYKKLSVELKKSKLIFELQETTKDSKKKVYGPYKGCLDNEKIKIKMEGGVYSNNEWDTTNRIQIPPPENEKRYNKNQIEREFEVLYTTPVKKIRLFSETRKKLEELLRQYNRATIENRKELENKYKSYLEKSKKLFDVLYVPPENLVNHSIRKENLEKLLKQYIRSSATNENKKALENKYRSYTINSNISEPNKQKLFRRFIENANRYPNPPYMNYPSENTYLPNKLSKNRTLQIDRARRAKEKLQNNFEDTNLNNNNN